MHKQSKTVFDTSSPEFVSWMSSVWRMNDERNRREQEALKADKITFGPVDDPMQE